MDLRTLLTSWYFIALVIVLIAALAAWPRSRTWCRAFLKSNSEFLTIPTAFVLWGYSDNLLKTLDKTSKSYDGGVFQIILFSIIALLLLHGFIRLYLKLQWPTINGHIDSDAFANDFKVITPWERIKASLFVFFGLLFALVLLSRVL